MLIDLLRHGKTEGNHFHRYIGRTDEPLCDIGRQEAEALPKDYAVSRVFVTPLQRTKETAAILFPQAKQEVLPLLKEMDFGVFENRSATEMQDDQDFRAWVEGNCLPPCPGGESLAAFSERVCQGFAQAVENLRKSQVSRGVFVVHGGTIMAILARFARPKRGFYDSLVKNCQGFRCVVSPADQETPFTLREITPFVYLPREGKSQ